MNAFNRLAMAMVSLFVLAVAIGVILILSGVLTPHAVLGEGALTGLATNLAALTGGARAAAFAIAGLVAALSLVLLWLEVTPPRGGRTPFLVADTDLGKLTVEREGVCRLAEKTAEELRQVTACRATMTLAAGSGGEAGDATGVTAYLVVTVTPGSVVGDAAREVQRRVREVLEAQVGLSLREVQVRVKIGTAEAPPPQRTVE